MPSLAPSKPEAVYLQWRHKFRTPKKERKSSSNNSSWLNSTPAMLQHQHQHQHQNTIESNGEQYLPQETKLPLTYEVMRSIVAALAYIEECDDQHCRSFLCNSNLNQQVDLNTHKEMIEATRRLILLDDNIAPVESFAKINNVNIVSAGVKAAIKSCEPVIPEMMEQDLYKIEKKDSEKVIEKFLGRMPEVHMILCIEIFHHVSKTVKAQMASDQSKDLLNQLANEVGELIVPNSSAPWTTRIAWYQFRKKKLRRRVMKTMIRYFAIETKSTGTSTQSVQEVDLPTEDSALNQSDISDASDFRQHDNLKLSNKSNPYYDDAHLVHNTNDSLHEEDINAEIDDVKKSLFPELDTMEVMPDWIKLRELGHTFDIYMDDIKKEAIRQMRFDAEILNEAQCRLHAAEMVLNPQDVTPSVL